VKRRERKSRDRANFSALADRGRPRAFGVDKVVESRPQGYIECDTSFVGTIGVCTPPRSCRWRTKEKAKGQRERIGGLNRGGRKRAVAANMRLQVVRTNGADIRDKAGDLKGLACGE
jgi:hypothetical protein